MQMSETIGKLSAALSKVQAQLKPAKENAKNPFFKSTYADLGSVWDSARDLLSANGLAVIQMPTGGGAVMTMMTHSSGEWISSEFEVPVAKRDAHGVGSAISYARRYALASFVGVVTGDDDGSEAVTPEKEVSKMPQKKEKLSSEKYQMMLDAISKGKGVVVQQKIGNYTLTKTQQAGIDKALSKA